MSIRVVVGAQWGDEGKGKIVDLLSKEVDYVVRYQGGANAGHTLKFDDTEIVLHLIPSGIFHGSATCVIGNGVVIDPNALIEEIANIRKLGVELDGRLIISNSAHVILPYHQVLDNVKEEHRGDDAIGTTGRGIGPAYVSKISRVGIRTADLAHPEVFRDKMEQNIADINEALQHVYKVDPLEPGPMIEKCLEAGQKLCPYVRNTSAILHDAVRDGKEILLEGAQGSLLDVDHGTYPYVTSSSPTAGGACTGTGIPPTAITHVMGITKAYCTRVGNGPFPTELDNEFGEQLRQKGKEFGATTGRPRRCGWLDLVALKYAVQVNGMNELAITKMDVLNGLDKIKVCTGYRIGDTETDVFPLDLSEVRKAEPQYTIFEGWEEDVRKCDSIDALPVTAQKYLEFIQDYLGVEMNILSTGPRRSETIIAG